MRVGGEYVYNKWLNINGSFPIERITICTKVAYLKNTVIYLYKVPRK